MYGLECQNTASNVYSILIEGEYAHDFLTKAFYQLALHSVWISAQATRTYDLFYWHITEYPGDLYVYVFIPFLVISLW